MFAVAVVKTVGLLDMFQSSGHRCACALQTLNVAATWNEGAQNIRECRRTIVSFCVAQSMTLH
jgi:hypothetical protein